MSYQSEQAFHAAIVEFSDSLTKISQADISLTGSIRAVIASSHGVSSGQFDRIEKIEKGALDRALSAFCESFGRTVGFTEQGKRLFDYQVRKGVERVLKKHGAFKVSGTYRYRESNQAPKAPTLYVDPNNPHCVIGLAVTFPAPKMSDPFGDIDQREPIESAEHATDAGSVNDAVIAQQGEIESMRTVHEASMSLANRRADIAIDKRRRAVQRALKLRAQLRAERAARRALESGTTARRVTRRAK